MAVAVEVVMVLMAVVVALEQMLMVVALLVAQHLTQLVWVV